jgi:hypothetical protein
MQIKFIGTIFHVLQGSRGLFGGGLKNGQQGAKGARCVLDQTFCSQSATHKKPSHVTQKSRVIYYPALGYA